MSLINKMLQDLDQRGSGPSGSLASSVKLAPQSDRQVSWPLLVGVIAAAALAAVAGAVFWRSYKSMQAAPAVSVAKLSQAQQAKPAAPSSRVAVPTVDATGSPIVPAASAPAASAPAASSPALSSPAESSPAAASASISARQNTLAAAQDGALASVSAAASIARPTAPPDKVDARAGAAAKAGGTAKTSKETKAASVAKAAKAAKAAKVASVPPTGLEMNKTQQAEAQYRKGLTSLQDGRNGEAIAALEQALRLDSTHEAARQTVVGLLIEARRSDEALRHLQMGLTLEPRQPAMAMLLARLQIERGGSGIETLMRTLPYATGNADYHAFLAGALARESRHQEAAEHYRLALRGAPQNGMWLIGLGISLQTEKRDAEALDAFKRAKASGSLTPELLTYAERRINALSR